MTIIGIWKAKRNLYRFQRECEIKKRYEKVDDLANRIGAYIHIRHTESQDEFVKEIISKIHIVLQTEMMLQACVFAAAAAFFSFISIVLFLFFR